MMIKRRIFLLDDDELISSMLARSLVKEGYEIRSETSTHEIIDKIASWCPDLVLLDIHLDEDKNGLDILEEMKTEQIPGEDRFPQFNVSRVGFGRAEAGVAAEEDHPVAEPKRRLAITGAFGVGLVAVGQDDVVDSARR